MQLMQPISSGSLRARNRVWMAPLTRCRAPGGVPTALNAEYYAQRAGAGVIVSEATNISREATGYPDTPGVYTKAQVDGWRLVTDAVHAAGGVIVCQLWHVGRVSHPDYHDGELPVAPSAINVGGECRVPDGSRKQRVTPRALETSEIPRLVNDYVYAAKMAMAAGFDGVEVHGANTYLLDQFLRSGSNVRTDQYGGGVQNRARLLMDVLDAVCSAIGSDRTGLRLSPSGETPTHRDENPRETFTHVVRELNRFNLAYLHLLRYWGDDAQTKSREIPLRVFRDIYRGRMVANGKFTPDEAETWLARGDADAVAFGELFISNPDLPQRIAKGVALTPPDRSTYYTSGPKGYTDYPSAT
ncbi:MAG TPA: alkene reductase [Phycisphaerales bacterium]|nr:alkene reductase [Phycisphaerales bacterium]